MVEEATVADILACYKMMFGDVNPPHVLLAVLCCRAECYESMTAWYARLEDLASRIIRKDASFITSNNYDVIVNMQFWTKMSQFVVETRKIETEFAARTAKIQQGTTEPTSALKKSLDSIKDSFSSGK